MWSVTIRVSGWIKEASFNPATPIIPSAHADATDSIAQVVLIRMSLTTLFIPSPDKGSLYFHNAIIDGQSPATPQAIVRVRFIPASTGRDHS
jgi:hypothetical protein